MRATFLIFSVFLVLLSRQPDLILSARSVPYSPIFSPRWSQQFYHERGNFFEGDILLQNKLPNGEDALKAGSNEPRWIKGVIPFYFHPNIRGSGRQAIKAAMQDIQSKTCIRFTLRNRRERDYVYITSHNPGCYSYVGRNGGRQELNIGQGCWHKTTIIHELVHAVGFWHEQSRLDRDDYVKVEWNNIPRNFWREFQKHSSLNDFDTEYDLQSVMHYSYNAFARNKRRPSISTVESYPLRLLGTGDEHGGLTETDALQINRMYNCTFDDPPRKYNSIRTG